MDEKPESMHLARRAFLKNAARIGFAVPVITTFTMAGIGEASADCRGGGGNQTQGGGGILGGIFGHDKGSFDFPGGHGGVPGNRTKHGGVSGNLGIVGGGRFFGRT